MNLIFKKTVMAALAAALLLAAFPANIALAQEGDPPREGVTNEKLEQVWARQLKTYERLGKAFDQVDDRLGKLQDWIDKAALNGRDVTSLQAALDAFKAAVLKSRPIYDSMAGIINSHAGFDEIGKVTDTEQAKETIRELRAKMQKLKSSMGGTGKALRNAIRSFREANKPEDTPTERDS